MIDLLKGIGREIDERFEAALREAIEPVELKILEAQKEEDGDGHLQPFRSGLRSETLEALRQESH